jgi:putative transposase
MKMPTYSAEQILKILELADKGEQTVSTLCRDHGIAEATFYRWRKTYRGRNLQEVQRLKELEKENARLKRMLAERLLEIDLLKEVMAKKP